MQALTVLASNFEVAERLFGALLEFKPEVVGKDDGYEVTVSLGADAHIGAVLSAILRHVTAQNGGPAPVELGGRRHTVHPEHPAQALLADCPEVRAEQQATADKLQTDDAGILGPHEVETLRSPQLTLIWGGKAEGRVH